MVKLTLKISFISILLILLSFQSSISLETKNQDQPHQVMKTQEISKSLKIFPNYGTIPLYFIPNEGQVHDKALFYAKASRYTLWLTKEGLVFDSIKRIKKGNNESRPTHPKDRNNPEGFTCERDVSRLIFLNSKKNPEVVPEDQTEHKVNYFIGKDESKWRTNIQTSRVILYKDLYRNIDLRVYGIEKQIEYDFIVKPYGEVSDISFEYRDVEKTTIDKDGNLVIETKFGELEHAKPACYQLIEGERVKVEARFKRIENNTYGFKIKEYNRNYELIIDPLVLVYSTYLGGSDNDECFGIAVDTEGAAYVTGYTGMPEWPIRADFPTLNPIQGINRGRSDVFIAKVNSSGSALVYSTYLGGSGADEGHAIAVDSEGAAYVTGQTGVPELNEWLELFDFPTLNPIQGTMEGLLDVFITKVNSSGSALIYSTYLGGSYSDWGYSIAVDAEGAAYVTGRTGSTDFPTQNPIQGTNAGLDDAFIAKVNSSGSALIYSTYLGGSYQDGGGSIAVDSDGAAYVTGFTGSTDFPTQNPIQGSHAGGSEDGFTAKVNSSGSALIYSTYLGGSGYDSSRGIAVDSEGAVYVIGDTYSTDFPTQNPIQEINAGLDDVFITKVNSSGSALIYSTYLGGSREDFGNSIAVDSEGAAYVAGQTCSTDFPTQNPIQGTNAGCQDVFIAKLYFTCSLTITTGSGGTTDPSPANYTYDFGTEVTITAIPDSGYEFNGWTGDVPSGHENDNPVTVTMDEDKSITANFKTTTTGDGDSEEKKNGCFIATAAYGTPLHPHLDILRDFRNTYLMSNKPGRVLVNLYYKCSPFIANLIAKNKALKIAVRISLLPLVELSYSLVHFGPIITSVIPVFIFVLPIILVSLWRKKRIKRLKNYES